MFDLRSLSDDAQVAIFVIVAENAIKQFENSGFIDKAKNAIDCCWRWIEEKNIRGDDLYDLLDDEWGDDLANLQMESQSVKDSDIWDCVINSVVYTCSKAYDAYNENWPQIIEGARDIKGLFEYSKDKLIKTDKKNKEALTLIEQYFMENYLKSNTNKLLIRSDFEQFVN